MPDGRPHRWAPVVKAWADGGEVHHRLWDERSDRLCWGPWRVTRTPPIREDLNIEYRVRPEVEPHQWQLEKEAFLAGKAVEFRMRGHNAQVEWRRLDTWLVEDCVKRQTPPTPIWDRPWLEFRVKTF
jgi:hypothetical protein